MTIRKMPGFTLLLALLLTSGIAAASDDHVSWRIAPDRSTIGFELSAMGIVPIRGSFAVFAGELWRDPADGHLRVSMRIDSTSLTMASDRYRDWARSREFFDVRRHPEIVFRSGPVPEALLTGGGELAGTLRLRGIERDVSFQVESGTCSLRARRCELRVFGQINRRQFGMTSRRLTLSDRVNLDMRFVAMPAPTEPTATPSGSDQP
jgi:polyisoprenoid-binding protein YceI